MNKRIIYSVFEQAADSFASQVAVEDGSVTVTYGELNARANRYANFLREAGAGRDKIVATIFPSDISMVVNILGVFKSGAIYLPLSDNLSDKRLSKALNKCSPVAIVVHQSLGEQMAARLKGAGVNADLIYLYHDDRIQPLQDGREEVSLSAYSSENAQLIKEPSDSSYIFYTSGSSGEPKAILGSHDSLSHFIHWEKKEFEVDDSFRVSQLTSPTFDASLRDIFVPLTTGGTLCIPSKEVKEDIGKLVSWIQTESITLIHSVPSLFRAISRAIDSTEETSPFPDLKYFLLAGESLYGIDVNGWYEKVGKHVELVNLYGATESTMIKTFHRINQPPQGAAEKIHVGKPISNTAILIMNDNLCGVGEIGEVYIRTPFLTKGYYKDEDRTAAVFIQNPMISDKKDIIYRTGDLGRYLPSGEIEILGRLDNQVKVNGIRVEPGEVETAMLSIKGVDETVVMSHTDEASNTELICYYTGEESSASLPGILERSLNKDIIPSYFIKLEEIPLNINGKVDKKALPKPDTLLIKEEEFEEVQGDTEKTIEAIWKEVLGLNRIGRNASFFTIGGNSLKAIQMISRLYKTYNVMILVRDIFTASTIAKLAEKIDSETKKSEVEPIERLAEQPHYPLSHAQNRLWVLDQFGEAKSAYNVHSAFAIDGPLDAAIFRQTILELVKRHEAIRTIFLLSNGEPRQKVVPFEEAGITVRMLKDVNEEELCEIVKAEAAEPFDLTKGPLVRLTLGQLSEEQHVFSFTMHHIISDAWSVELLINESFRLYKANLDQKDNPLNPLRIQYRDFATWQNDQLANDEHIAEHRNFWLSELKGELPKLNLPADYPRPVHKTYNGDSVKHVLSHELLAKLQEAGRNRKGTLFTTLLTLTNTLLYQYTGQSDIIIGTPVAGRYHEDLEGQVGFYINNLPLRNSVSGVETFSELLAQHTENALEALNHQAYPFDRMVDDLGIIRDTSRSPVFDVVLVLQNMGIEDKGNALEGITVGTFDSGYQSSAMDLRMVFQETNVGLYMMFEYNTDLFARHTIERMVANFVTLCESALTAPSTPLNELPVLDDKELNLIRTFSAGTKTEELTLPLIQQNVERSAKEYAASACLVHNETSLTYAEVNEEANRLARYLRDNMQLGKGDVVALMAPAGIRTVISLLGIIKAGAVYLPIDPELPSDRKGYMLRDSGAKTILTEADQLADIGPDFQGSIFAIDIQWEEFGGDGTDLPVVNSGEDPAYIIYTSGSTGTPKGVSLSHRSQVNMTSDQIRRFSMTPSDAVLQFASLSFDASVYEIFLALYAGATLVLKDKSILFDSGRLIDYLQEKHVTVAVLPPSYLSTLPLDRLKFMRVLITAGEAANASDLTRLSAAMDCYNAYGPTECAVCVSTYKVTPSDADRRSVPIGKPIANTTLYVLDDSLNYVPVGVEGQIYIGGAGLALGYVNNAPLTEKSFVISPFDKEERLYASGDKGKWLADGNLAYSGRIDRQVKISGYRIEPGEVEQGILLHPEVRNAYVSVSSEGPDSHALVAWVVAPAISIGDIRTWAKKVLPSHMVPVYITAIDEMPLTSNGKIDEMRLPEPDKESVRYSTEFKAPESDVEKQLAEIWQNLLGTGQSGVLDNFFEAGGQSLKATRLIADVNAYFNIRIDLGQFFLEPTIRSLAYLVEQADKESGDDIVPLTEQDNYPVSNAQRRLWVLNQIGQGSTAYNLTAFLNVTGEFDPDRLRDSLHIVIKQYEILRTNFGMDGDELRQFIHTDISPERLLDIVYPETGESEASAKEKLLSSLSGHNFDLEEGPLLKVIVLVLPAQKYLVGFGIHHIISDEASMAILVQEWITIYQSLSGNSKPNLKKDRVHYKDFAAWQNNKLESGNWDVHKAYWLDRFSDGVPVVDLPATFPRPEMQTHNGDSTTSHILAGMATQLQSLSEGKGTSLFTTLCATVFTLLHKYNGTEDLVIGTPVTQRTHHQLQDQIGLYLNLLPLRIEVGSEKTFEDILAETKTRMIEAFSHQEYPFDQLVEDLKLERRMDRSPLFDIMVVMHDAENEEAALPVIDGATIHPVSLPSKTSRYDITINFRKTDQGLSVNVEYNSDLFSADWAKRFISHYETLLQSIVTNTQSVVSDLTYLSETERERLLAYNETDREFPREETLISLIEKQAAASPDKEVYRFGQVGLTFEQLNKYSNQVAHYLVREGGVKKGDKVCLLMDRSEKMMISLLGVLKAGAAYVPIDTTNPIDRINYILDDAQPGCLITDDERATQLDLKNGRIITVENWPDISRYPEENIVSATAGSEDVAYIIYTSGTTGNPKGVVIEHRGVVNRLHWMWDCYSFSDADIILQKTPYAFDVSVWELFMPFMFGAKAVMTPREVVYDLQQLVTIIHRHRVTTVHFVPSMLEVFLNGLGDEDLRMISSLKRIICSGEALSAVLSNRVHERLNVELINLYGPTEASIDVSHYTTQKQEDIVPIGKPIDNTSLFILDKKRNLAAEGIPGELAIGGVGLARHYHNRPDLTEDKFIYADLGRGEERLYLSGDLARILNDGNIQYLGRIDRQVKLFGQRIELGEIEAVLRDFDKVSAARVKVYTPAGAEPLLVAFYISEEQPDHQRMREFMVERLPRHMVPGFFVQLDEMPLTANGKLDDKKLNVPDNMVQREGSYEAPAGEIEDTILAIWKEVLNREKIGVTDNFFDVGGNSMRLIIIFQRLGKLFPDLTVTDLFRFTTVRSLSGYLGQEEENFEVEGLEV
ncbi:MAG: amino acid adenylation domain-containing protein [Cyclobacteriaceae bacterium]